MSEEIEVKVRQVANEQGGNSNEADPIVDLMRRLLMASIGAVALTYDEAERLIKRLVERGELAQKDGEKVLNELMGRLQQQNSGASSDDQSQPFTNMNIGGQIESGLEQLLNSLNIPSRRDIDDLSTKMAQLAERVEELRKTSS
jgi:poly(hydroxyalkanoate) granule-associated protein